jgi:hypothetical protein
MTQPDPEKGTYKPRWIALKRLNQLDVRPHENTEQIYFWDRKRG